MPDYSPHKGLAGGFSPSNGTIDFYLRISTYLNSEAVVVDLGAGRGGWYHLEKNALIRRVRYLKPHVKSLIGVDVDPAVMANPTTTENLVMEGMRIPLNDQSADLIFADYVIEHIADPHAFKNEIERVLKPGGVFCARTPHSLSYVSLAARLIPNSRHAFFLGVVQPDRQAQDVFPTLYRLNTLSAIHRIFHRWKSSSFIYRTDPSYYFGSAVAYRLLDFVHRITPRWFSGNLMVFLEKPE